MEGCALLAKVLKTVDANIVTHGRMRVECILIC
jgi:hypothetical protein